MDTSHPIHHPFELAVPLDRSDHVLGPDTAAVVVVEYGDFECPNCRQAYPAVKQLLRHFQHRLRFAYRHFPLTEIHPHAQLAAAHRRLEEKAARDDMTGMLNRESFFATLDGSRRESDRGALLIVDADHFKSINDRYGHLTGDDALLLIAAAIRRGVRSGDVLGRIGGEEFGAFLVGANESEASRIAERIRREVELIRFRPVDERTVPLTGYRFTCTLNTFMKIDTRSARPPMNAGSSTSVIRTTLPSAGATTRCSPRSPLRSGSRKK